MRLLILTALAVTPALVFAACSSGGEREDTRSATPTERQTTVAVATSDAAPPDQVPEYAGGAAGYSHFVFEQVGDKVVTTVVEGPRESQVRVPISYLQLKELLASDAPVPSELQMTGQELALLVEQLDTVRASTEKYRDINVALAEGYIQTTEEVPNMGAHFLHPGRQDDGVFNPAEPEILLYVRDDKGDWQLVGTSFVLPRAQFGDDHPEAFAGPLDNWHVHYSLCISPNTSSHSADATECQREGGLFLPSYGWMIHAWVWADNPLGAFPMWNTNLPPYVSEATIRETRTGSAVARSTESIDASADGPHVVSIENFAHSTIEVGVGESVVWLNVDGVPHTVSSGSSGVRDEGFDSGLFGPGRTFSLSFDKPGVYAFTCTLHPQMNGTIIVNPT